MESSISAINSVPFKISALKVNWLLLLEYLKVLIWPSLVFFLSLLFKNEIKNWLNRIYHGKFPGGFEFDSPISQDNPKKDIKKIKEAVKIKKYEKDNTKTGKPETKEKEKQIEQLKNDNAVLQIALFFEKTYTLIYGSQINLLEKLRVSGIQGIRYENIAADYERTKQFWPNLRSYSLAIYLKFLEDSKFIELNISNNNTFYKITPTGIDFLQYIESLNYLKAKAF